MPPPLTLLSDYREVFIFTNPFRRRSAIIREAAVEDHGLQSSRATGHPAPQASAVRLRIRFHMTCPRSQRKSVMKQDKGCKASLGTTTQRGQPVTVRQSSTACHWAKRLCDPSQKYSAFLSAFYIFTFTLSCMPESNIIWCVCRHNKITVNPYSGSKSPLIFSLKIEIRRGKKKKNTSFETWQEQ